MSQARCVYMSLGRLLLDPPGTLVYHEHGRAAWPRYSADEDSAFVQYRDGEERHWTRCGRIIYESVSLEDGRAWNRPTRTDRHYDGLRLDNAERIGRPCRVCFRAAA